MRQLIIQLFQEGTAYQFRNGFFRTFFSDLFGRIHLRTFRHVFDKHVLDLGKIVVLECADWHDIGEIGELVDFDKLADQSFTAQFVDFSDDGNQRHFPFERAVIALHCEIGTQTTQNALVAWTDLLITGQQESNGVHVGKRLIHNIIQALPQQCARAMDTGRVNQNDLRIICGKNATNGLTCGFRSR